MAIEWVIAIAGLAVTITVWSLFVSRRARTEPNSEPAQVRRIRINGMYQPSEVHVSAGQPMRLIFRREETVSCSERVVFPDYGISVMLPAFEEVAVDLPPSEPGEHEFTCQLEMLHGRLIVDPWGPVDHRGAEAVAR